MSEGNNRHRDKPVQDVLPVAKDFEQAANDLCEKALNDAKSQLHPLLQSSGLDRLAQRAEFLQSFRNSLEQRIARKLVNWHPGVQAVFRYDEAQTESIESWNGSIRLLVKVPRLSKTIRALGKKLDASLAKHLKQTGWQRIPTGQSILEIHQVTPHELRYGIGYAAMFYAVYTAPVKVWPQDRQAG